MLGLRRLAAAAPGSSCRWPRSSILAGIKTAAIWTVGTATLAAFIGGGGYGTLIVRGLALDDVTTILAGAIPAALMALLLHGLFEPSTASSSPAASASSAGRPT